MDDEQKQRDALSKRTMLLAQLARREGLYAASQDVGGDVPTTAERLARAVVAALRVVAEMHTDIPGGSYDLHQRFVDAIEEELVDCRVLA